MPPLSSAYERKNWKPYNPHILSVTALTSADDKPIPWSLCSFSEMQISHFIWRHYIKYQKFVLKTENEAKEKSDLDRVLSVKKAKTSWL